MPNYNPYQFNPYTYTPMPQSQTINAPYVPQSQPQPQQNNALVWVQGEAGAKAYPVAAGNTVLLMDSETSTFYIKSVDSTGIPKPLRTFTYTEILPEAQPVAKEETVEYATKAELNELKKMLEDLTK